MKLFIDNEWINAEDSRTFQTICPSTEIVIADVALASTVRKINTLNNKKYNLK